MLVVTERLANRSHARSKCSQTHTTLAPVRALPVVTPLNSVGRLSLQYMVPLNSVRRLSLQFVFPSCSNDAHAHGLTPQLPKKLLLEDQEKSMDPAIANVKPSFNGDVRVEVEGSGDCYPISCMLAVVLNAVRSPTQLKRFIDAVQGVRHFAGARLKADHEVNQCAGGGGSSWPQRGHPKFLAQSTFSCSFPADRGALVLTLLR